MFPVKIYLNLHFQILMLKSFKIVLVEQIYLHESTDIFMSYQSLDRKPLFSLNYFLFKSRHAIFRGYYSSKEIYLKIHKKRVSIVTDTFTYAIVNTEWNITEEKSN